MLICRSIILCFIFVPASQVLTGCAGSPQTLRYTVLMNNRVAGSEIDTYSPNGHIDGRFEFNDRGRGPKISAHYEFSPDGTPLRTDVTGNDYLKAPVDEHFALDQGRAHWKSG